MEEIKVGSPVRLASGGPLMTVCSIEGTVATCQRFENGSVKEAKFELAALRLMAERAAPKVGR